MDPAIFSIIKMRGDNTKYTCMCLISFKKHRTDPLSALE